jgi:hypothetical protein
MKTNCLILLTVICALGGITSGLAQSTDPLPSQPAKAGAPEVAEPKIQFADTEFDFGKLNGGEVARHDFVFTNTGTATLEIKDVRPSCGCTTAGTWDRQVEPGKTGVIPLQFNSAGFGGTVSKSAIVMCNDPGHTNVVLHLKATVWKPFDVLPATTVFNVSSEAPSNETRVVRIVSNLEEPVELSDVQCSSQSFRTELKTVQPNKEFELYITAVPPFASNTTFAAFTITTSSPRMPKINVNAYVMVQQPMIVAPNQIMLPMGRLAAAMSQSVKILNRGTNALALSDASVNTPGVEVRLQEIQPGRVFSLMVNFPAGFEIKMEEKVEVSVKSNHPKFPVIKVPVFQSRPPAVRAATPSVLSDVRALAAKPEVSTAPGK